MNITINDFEYRKGNVSSTQTIEKTFFTLAKAKAHASKLPNCIGFCVENEKKPVASKEYMCHFKEGPSTILDIGQWHTYLSPTNTGSDDVAKPIDNTGRGATLQVPAGGGKKSKHTRSVTNFCKEANIGESDQLDLAEFILAARYLGTDANQDQLMNAFMEMEEDSGNKDPKQLIKELMQKVAEDYGLDNDGDAKADDAADADGSGDDEPAGEIMAANPLDIFAEDAIWQEDQIDSFLNQNQQDQGLKIARNLLATTALTRKEIAEITGVEADLLADYESDYSSDEEESGDDEEEDEDEPSKVDKAEKAEKTDKPAEAKEEKAADEAQSAQSAAVMIKASEFSKSVMLTKEDLGSLKELLDGGKDSVSGKSEEALKLLKKLNDAIHLNPKGHSKRTKTLARLKVDKVEDGGDAKAKAKPTEVKLPAKYRVVIHPGALCKDGKELSSKEVCKLPIGTVVTVEEVDGRRARITSPSQGWLSLHASDGRIILERSNVKSAAMDKAIHAERARQTKVLILKSITTLNDATVTRILEKSDWNLRRAIEAFYIAKYKTQEYLTKKEKKEASKGSSGKKGSSEQGKASGKSSPVPAGGAGAAGAGAGKKGKTAWWKSWKTFANDNQ